MKKIIKKVSLVICGFVLFSTFSYAADKVVVIVNKANTQQFSIQDIKNIYNDQVGSWEKGGKVLIYNLPVKSSVREVFSANVLGLSAQAAAAEVSRRKINNTLKNTPRRKRERLVASIVSKKPSAIGYVSAKAIKGKTGVRVVLTLDN